MMKLLYKLERKFGRYAIRDLMKYIIALYAIGFVINLINPYIYYLYLSLDVSMILKGQVWRLVTFIIQPPSSSTLFVLLSLYLYYIIGTNLERVWGAFRFNLYFFVGIFGHIVAAFAVYIISMLLTGEGYVILPDTTYLNFSLFFAYGLTYPEAQVYVFFVLPVKMKVMAYIELAVFAISIITAAIEGDWTTVVAIAVSMINVFVFFFATRNYRRIDPRDIYRRHQFQKQVRQATAVTKHKCAICGKTEQSDEDAVFRFCSKCDGNYEYCQDHLFTHEHIKHN